MNIFGSKKKSGPSQEDIKALIRKEQADAEFQKLVSENADPMARAMFRQSQELAEQMKGLANDTKRGDTGNGSSDWLTLFQKMGLDQALVAIPANNAKIDPPVTTANPIGAPVGTNGQPIGGQNYDPAVGNSADNGRILKWLVNTIKIFWRVFLAYSIQAEISIKWELLSLLSGDSEWDDGFLGDLELGDLLWISLLLPGVTGSNSGLGGLFGGLLSGGGMGGLFGAGSAIARTDICYPTV